MHTGLPGAPTQGPGPLSLSVLLGFVSLPPTSFLFFSRALLQRTQLIHRGFSSLSTGLDLASQPQPGQIQGAGLRGCCSQARLA